MQSQQQQQHQLKRSNSQHVSCKETAREIWPFLFAECTAPLQVHGEGMDARSRATQEQRCWCRTRLLNPFRQAVRINGMLRISAPIKVCFLLTLALLAPISASAAQQPIAWQAWSPAAFAQAKTQHRYVFLYLEAVWCHWCHVMQKETFSDPAVQQALAHDYIAIKVDHDANPLLATRYRDYGWPALIFLAPDGTEIVKRAGYLGPENFQKLLAAIVKDPSPEAGDVIPAANIGNSHLDAALRSKLLKLHDDDYDAKLGGLSSAQKFIDRDSIEYAMTHASDKTEANKAKQTLDAARALIDPAWGGVYQYSTGGDWQHPHFEKIMRVQAGYLRTYAQAYALWHRDTDLQAARAISRYMKNFLRSPQGAFYVSQDADLIQGKKADDYFKLDDKARRQLGMPHIDQHLYADANGQAIEALVQLYEASGDVEALQLAQTGAKWVVKNRALKGGGYSHDKRTGDAPYLSDSLAMGRASLALYRATAKQEWLTRSAATAHFIVTHFRAKSAGFLPGVASRSPLALQADIADNIAAARYFNLLSYYLGDKALKVEAEHAMKFLSAAATQVEFEEIGILIADNELITEPAHFTVVASHNVPVAASLYAAALRAPGTYKRVEWWDPTAGPLPNPDVSYPKLAKAGAFICAAGRCSLPSFTPDDYAKRIAAITGG